MPAQNVDAAYYCEMMFKIEIFRLRIKAPADLAAAGQNSVSTMYFVFVSCLLSSVHFICMGTS